MSQAPERLSLVVAKTLSFKIFLAIHLVLTVVAGIALQSVAVSAVLLIMTLPIVFLATIMWGLVRSIVSWVVNDL